MMRPQDILKLLRAQPFRPFRIALSDGSQYDLRHPELAFVERSVMTIGIPGPGGLEQPLERTMTVALLHINKAKPLDASNGSRTRKRRR